MGRPSKMTDEVQAEILKRISTGESLRKICSNDHLPNAKNVFSFIYTNDEFRNKYEASRREQAEWLGEEIVDIADNDTGDTQRDRLRIDARKWVMSKMLPKKYSDKIDVDMGGEVDINIRIGGSDSTE